MLTGNEIRKQVQCGKIVISDFNESRLNPNSYNLRLSNKLLTYKSKLLDLKNVSELKMEEIIIPESGLILEPNTLYLGLTMEYTETHNHIPILEGRSSIGRVGLQIHLTAGVGDIGFCGTWTLELSCVQPVRIYPNIEICQIMYFEPKGIIDKTYNGRYQNQIEPTKSFFDR